MTLILNGTDNSATTPAVTGTDTDTGVYYPAANQVALATNGTQAMLANASQGVQFANAIGVGATTPTTSGAGITFPATQSASSDANTLDDYEEGTFTPALTAGTTNPTVTYVVQSGNYTRLGRVVSISARLQISAISGGSGAIRISGLPFANAMGICGAHSSWISNLTLNVGTTWADTYFEGNDLHICIACSGTTTGAQQLLIGAVGASFDTSIQFTYQTS